MPWNPYRARVRTEQDPQIRDVWAVLRQMQSTVGGMSSELANIALSVNRSDTRLEAVTVELNRVCGRLEATATALAVLAKEADRPWVDDD